jgi:hypothetical protein
MDRLGARATPSVMLAERRLILSVIGGSPGSIAAF